MGKVVTSRLSWLKLAPAITPPLGDTICCTMPISNTNVLNGKDELTIAWFNRSDGSSVVGLTLFSLSSSRFLSHEAAASNNRKLMVYLMKCFILTVLEFNIKV